MSVIIHAFSHAAQDSDFFDRGASPIQLVPISDLQTFTTMHRVWKISVDQDRRESRDEQTNRQFRILLDHQELTRRVTDLKEEVRELWLLRKYAGQWVSDEFYSVARPGAIFLASEPLAETLVLSPVVAHGTGLKFDYSHPWVRAMIETMPSIHPVVMFRHYTLKCYNTTTENLW